MALLEVRGLRAGYEGIPVIFGIDLDVAESEVVALLGSNGAGKTTTLRAVSGMVSRMGGSITFDGHDITHRSADAIARAGLLHVPDNRGVFPSLAVAETLRLAAAMTGLDPGQTRERIDAAYATFPRLSERSSQTAGTLSGGEQQMLALARGLIARPRLLMVDEMSQGLAPTIVADLFTVLDQFRAQGVSVLLVEQFVEQALAVATRAYVMEKGEISFSGSAAELAANEEFVRSSYLGDIEEARPAAVGGRRQRPSAVSGDGHGSGGRGEALGEGHKPITVLAEKLNISLPPALLRTLQGRAEQEGVALEDLVRQLVETSAPAPEKDPAPQPRKRAAARRSGSPKRAVGTPRRVTRGGRSG